MNNKRDFCIMSLSANLSFAVAVMICAFSDASQGCVYTLTTLFVFFGAIGISLLWFGDK